MVAGSHETNMNVRSKCTLEKLLDEAAKQLRFGGVYLDYRIELEKALAKTQDVYNSSPLFFRFILNSLRDESILYLTRLVERRRDTLNLNRIKSCVEQYVGCCSQVTAAEVRTKVLPKLEKEIAEIEKKVGEIVKIRNNAIAHLNLNNVTNGIRPNSVMWSDIKKAYRMVHKSLDESSESCFGRGIGMLEIAGSRDFGGLLDLASDGLKYRLVKSAALRGAGKSRGVSAKRNAALRKF